MPSKQQSPPRSSNEESTFLRARPIESDPPGSISYLEHVTALFSRDSIQAFAGASAGVASSVVACPLDVIKIRLQGREGLRLWSIDSISIRRPFQDRGLIGTARVIWREEGLRGMYCGLGPTAMGYIPTWTIFFTIYHRSNESLSGRLGPRTELTCSGISAAIAGTCSAILTNPLWVITTRLMSQNGVSSQHNANHHWRYKSTLDAALKIYRNEGIISFYSGLTPSLVGVTHLAIQFPLYEQLKRYLTGAGLGKRNEGESPKIPGILIASILSKVCASSATYPHEVIRTRLQRQQRIHPSFSLQRMAVRSDSEQPLDVSRLEERSCYSGRSGNRLRLRYRGLIGTFNTVLKEEGWRVLYAGMGTSMIRAVPASATTLLVYEIVVQSLYELKQEGQRKLELQKGL
ncbi:mitochondrial carrier [Periconia macrospinosa]|uniref:Mitochondrial carrier n=1 Tax=Periconia macrospinosa TaxID=97972 RepID=A0A2V1D5M5_9PLEO|nr:mitochondrial carrier [Periconia macrospinosa]